ncbi:MAG TPA: NAD-dependent epimerase/dehydratase family protein [Burkholderiaceae bacterium]|nr:NAD-dependent epimerase/dehydratase family protein [Burkholderiaceae bacterium]
MRRALITGITGFTGRYMAAELEAAGYAVAGISHGEPPEGTQDVYACDLTDRPRLAEIVGIVKPDVVVHLAAIAFVAHDDAEAIYRVNVGGARNLLEALANGPHKPSSVLLASSANVYGNSTAGVLDETATLAPANDYAISKIAMEYMADLWRKRLPITIVRPFNYTGVGQAEHFLLPKIVSHFRRKAPVIELGSLDVVRDFSDVRTVVQCYRRLIESETPSGTIYNVCSGQGYSLQEVLALARRLSGHDLEVRVNPAFVRENEVRTLIGSKARLEAAVGPVPVIPLANTLQWMLEA